MGEDVGIRGEVVLVDGVRRTGSLRSKSLGPDVIHRRRFHPPHCQKFRRRPHCQRFRRYPQFRRFCRYPQFQRPHRHPRYRRFRRRPREEDPARYQMRSVGPGPYICGCRWGLAGVERLLMGLLLESWTCRIVYYHIHPR